MLPVKGDLEVVGEASVRATAETAGADRATVDGVVADLALHERGCAVAVHALEVVDVPARPCLHAGRAAIARAAL